MDEVSNRCVVLKGLPLACSKGDVKEVLELAHGDFRFVDRYDKLHLYELSESEVRWIVLFKTDKDAKSCIESGQWTCNTKTGRHKVTPDLCSDCIIPDDWILNEDWVVPEHTATNDETVDRFDTVSIEDKVSSKTAFKNKDFEVPDTISEEHRTSDNLPDDLQGAVGMSNSSSIYSDSGLDKDLNKPPKVEESSQRKAPPIPKARTTLKKRTVQYTFSDSVQMDLMSSAYLFGDGRINSSSGQEDDKKMTENSNKDVSSEHDKHVHVEVDKTPEPTSEKFMGEKGDKSIISTLNSYELFESGPEKRPSDDSTPDDEVKPETGKTKSTMISDEAVVKCTDSHSAEGNQTTVQKESEFQEHKNETDLLLADKTEVKHSGNQKVVKCEALSPTPEQSETHEGIIGPEEPRQPNTFDSTNQNMEEKERDDKLVSHMKGDDSMKDDGDIPTSEAQNAEYMNINNLSSQARQVPPTFPTGYEQFPYQQMPWQHYPYPMPMTFPDYPVGKLSANRAPHPYFPYHPMMFPPPMHQPGEKNAGNEQSSNTMAYYNHPYMPYQVPPMRYPMYSPQVLPFPIQAYQGYDVPNQIARQLDCRPNNSQKDESDTDELKPHIYDEVRSFAGNSVSSGSHSLRKKSDGQNIGERDFNNIEETERSHPVRERPQKSTGSDMQVSDDDEEMHLKHSQSSESRSNMDNKKVQRKPRSLKSRSVSGTRDENRKLFRTLSSHSQETNEVDDEEEEATVFKNASDDDSLNASTTSEVLYEEIKSRTRDQHAINRMDPSDRPPLPAPRKSTVSDTVTLRKHEDANSAGRCKVAPSVLPIYDSSGNDEREVARNTVLVKGLAENISQEMLELFFENKVKTGGGEIKDMNINKKKREATIIFCDENDAAAVLKRARSGESFVLTGVHLDVCEYIPSLINPLLIFVSNIAESSSEECIRNFIESKIDLDTEKIVFGETPGTALLYFTSPPDVEKLQQSCKKRPCDGALLNVSTVEKTKSVKVTQMSEETSTEAVGLYFENKRKSKGGDIEDVRCRNNIDGATEYIVTFVNYEDAERVSENRELKLDGKKLTTCLHYPCMELDEDSMLIIPEPVIFDDVNNYIIKFIKKSQNYYSLLQDKVAAIYGKVVISENDELIVECIVDPKDRNGQRKVKDWTAACKKVVKDILDEFVVIESKRVACEVWSELLAGLHNFYVSDPDQVSVFLNKDECFVIMVGTSTEVRRLESKLEKLIDDSELKIGNESEIITKKRKLLVYQMVLLRSTKFEDKLKSPTGTLEIDNENKELIFKGRKKDVDKRLEELEKMLKSFVSKSVEGFPKVASELTFKKETRDYIKGKFYKEKIMGVWNTKRSKEVIMNGRTEKEVHKASDIFMQSFAVTQIELDSDKAVIVSSEDGKSMICDLEKKHDGLALFDLKMQQLTIVSVDKIHEEIKAEFSKLFDVHTVVKEFLPTQPGRLEFVKKFQRSDLTAIEKQYIRLHVQINLVENRSKVGFQVIGKKDGCKLALNKLQKMLESVQCKIITKSWAGLDTFLTTEEGVNCIKDIELKEKCVVKVTSEKIKQLPNTKDDKVGVISRQNSDGKITMKVVTGSLVDENVDVIVNSTNKDIDLTVGMVSRMLLKAGGQQLADECQRLYPGGINIGDVAVTGAGGTLKCKYLFHGLLMKWDEGQGYSETVMERLITHCLKSAGSAYHKSIAFPALGTGALGFPADVVARTMFSAVKTFEASYPGSSLKEVHFVIWGGDPATIKAFEREYSLSQGSSYSSDFKRSSRFSFIQSDVEENVYDTGSGYTTTIDKVTWSVAQGDLTKAKTEAIVNSTIDDLNLNSGNISKAVLQAAGTSIQIEANARKQEFLDNGLVVTNSGKLFCQRIIHVRARNSEKGWISSIKKAFETVDKLGLTSVAFPALGTGGKGFTADSMAKIMVQAYQRFSSVKKQQPCLRLVQIIIFDSHMVDKFVKGIKETIDPSKSKGRFSIKFWQNKSEPSAKVTMQVFAESSYALEKVETKINCIHLQETLLLSSKAFESMDDRKCEELLSLKRNLGVNVEISNGRVLITGFGRKANTAVNLARRCVDKIESDAAMHTAETVTLPRGWTPLSSADVFKAVVLKLTDPAYIEIAKKFVAETGLPTINILKIEQIQNATLYTQYMGKKKLMKALGVKDVEKYLWHGTTKESVDKINKFGFDRNYNTGASHGVGVYFAVKASTSVQGYCRQDVAGQKYIYFAQVLTGDYAFGSQGIRHPPLNPKAPGRTCDSSTDNVQNPNFFVIFHDSQAYPSFLITFK